MVHDKENNAKNTKYNFVDSSVLDYFTTLNLRITKIK